MGHLSRRCRDRVSQRLLSISAGLGPIGGPRAKFVSAGQTGAIDRQPQPCQTAPRGRRARLSRQGTCRSHRPLTWPPVRPGPQPPFRKGSVDEHRVRHRQGLRQPVHVPTRFVCFRHARAFRGGATAPPAALPVGSPKEPADNSGDSRGPLAFRRSPADGVSGVNQTSAPSPGQRPAAAERPLTNINLQE